MNIWPECLKWYNIWYPLKNIWKWRYSIINSRPWDHQGVYLLLRDQLSYMEGNIRLHSNQLTKDEKCKDIKVCLNLLDRIIEDEYSIDKQNFDYGDEGWPNNWLNCKITPKYFLPKGNMFKISDSRSKNDRELLFKTLKRKLDSWWH